MAKLDLSAIYREKKEYKKAQEILDKLPEIDIDKKFSRHYYLKVVGNMVRHIAFMKVNYGSI